MLATQFRIGVMGWMGMGALGARSPLAAFLGCPVLAGRMFERGPTIRPPPPSSLRDVPVGSNTPSMHPTHVHGEEGPIGVTGPH